MKGKTMKTEKRLIYICTIILSLSVMVPAWAKESAGDLAKKTQNPISDLVTVQFQNNTFFETGPKGKTQNVLLFQPVLPMKLNFDWNFIARPIVPILNQPPFNDAQNRNQGIGNVQFQGFFSPKDKVGDWIVGFGPFLEFPTNSGPDNRFGSDNFSAGPAAVALQNKGHWVYGGLLFQSWSYAGSEDEVNLTSFQPFINYNLEDGWYISTAPTLTANWSAPDSRQIWTVPIGGGIGKVFKIGKQHINASLRAYHNIESPRAGADWQLQFSFSFLFPK
jgi:hypothetical protein